MAFKKLHEDFSVEIQIFGERNECGDKIYEYKIISKHSFNEVEKYCKSILYPSYYENEMPHLFVPEIIEFKNLTNDDNGLGNMFLFRVRKASTA